MWKSSFKKHFVAISVLVSLMVFCFLSCSRKDDPIDSESPSIYILNPTSEELFVTTEQTIRISGIAQDNVSLKSIGYRTSLGDEGVAEGLEEWAISDLLLSEGDNIITVTAADDSGNIGTSQITITKNQYLVFLGVPFVDNDCIYTNEATTLWITVNIAPNDHLIPSSVRLIEIDENNKEIDEVCHLFDDGDLEYGDEIKGDNVFSIRHTFNYQQEITKRFRVSAKSLENDEEVEGFSAIFTLSIVDKETAEQKVRSLMITQKQIEDKLNELSGMSIEEKEAELLRWLQNNDSVRETINEDGLIRIVHQSGLTSFVSFDKDNSLKGSIMQGDRRRKAPVIPLSEQTTGTISPISDATPLTRSFGNSGNDDTIIQNKEVLIWAPFEDSFPQAMETSLRPILEESPVGLSIKYVINEKCTRESVQDFTKYGIVILDTHGKGGDLIYTKEETGFLSDLVNPDEGLMSYLLSEVYNLVTMGNYDASKTYYAVTSKYIKNKLKNKFPNSIVFNGSCESQKTLKLSNAFIHRGAKTYLGFREKVSVSKCIEKADEFFSSLTGQELHTTGDAFKYDLFWDNGHENEYLMTGSTKMRFYMGLINGDFEYGNLNGWNLSGDGRVITQLGSQKPSEGYYMGIVSTGLGFTEAYGSISQSFRITNEKTLSIKWNFLSEEFLEYVGSKYQDYLRILISDGMTTENLFSTAIDSFASQYSLTPVSPGVVFDQGDVYMTGWRTSLFDISKYQGKAVTLFIESGDVGDSYYDSATLLDEIKAY